MSNTNYKKYKEVVRTFDIATYLLQDGHPDYTTAAVQYAETAIIQFANCLTNQFGSTMENDVTDLDAALRRIRETDVVRDLRKKGDFVQWLETLRGMITEPDARHAVITLMSQIVSILRDTTDSDKDDLRNRWTTIKARIEDMQG